MSKPTTPSTAGDRGVSELVGVVLLFGIVIAGSAMIFVSGSAVTDEVQSQSRVAAAESTFAEVDGTIQSLAQAGGSDAEGSNTEAIDLGSVDPNDAEIRKSGEMTITVNENSACSATMPLSALEYTGDGGTTVAYEGGAIWKRTDSGLVTQKAPEIGFRNGSLQLQLVRLEGTIENDEMNIDYERANSIEETRNVREQLFAKGSCRRPQNVTVSVTSEYHEGWHDHFEANMPGSADPKRTGPETVTAKMDIDAQFTAVDFTRSDGELGSADGNRITAPGSASGPSTASVGTADAETTTYPGTVRFLGAQNGRFDERSVEYEEEELQEVTLTYNETVEFSMSTETRVSVTHDTWEWDNETKWVGADKPPLDVSFVLDESGSMDDGKMEDARMATRQFLDSINDSGGHRVSVTGYDYCREYETWYGTEECELTADVNTYQPFTTDQDAASDALSELSPRGRTPIADAIAETSEQFREDGESDHNQVMVLLTDGKETTGDSPNRTAREEIPDGVTVYTVGVGDDVNKGVLKYIASQGADGSDYIPVSDSEDLESVFEGIARNETKKKVVVPNKEWDTVEEPATPSVPANGRDTITVNRTVGTGPEDDHLGVGDEVNVSGTKTASDERTVTKTVDVTKKTYGPDGEVTDTETVQKTVEVTVRGSSVESINGTKTLGEDRATNETKTRDVDLVSRPKLTVALDNGTEAGLWDRKDLNGPVRSVERGSYENFWVEGGSSVRIEPSLSECTSPTLQDGNLTFGGEDYRNTTCSAYGSSTDLSSNVEIVANGSSLPDPGSISGQRELEAMLTVDGKRYYKRVDGELKAWNLDSNQVLVFVEAADGDGSTTDANNVVLLAEVGKSTSEATGEYLVNVEVTSVSAEDEDEDDS